MKRSIILGVIAIALLVLYTTTMSNTFFPLIILLVFVLLNAIIFNEFSRRRHAKDKDHVMPYERTVDDLIAEYGEPEDVILINATRANEAMGVILAYKNFLVVEGHRIEKTDISDVTFNNSGTPYAQGEYQIIIAAGQKQKNYLHINAGYDAAWTMDVVEQIKKNL